MRNPALLAALLAIAGTGAHAEGDPTRRAERLEPTQIDAATGFSVRAYDLKAGTYYRWRLSGDGIDEYEVSAEELFESSWLDKVSIEGAAISMGGLEEIELGGEAEVDVWFVPIRPGDYEFEVEGRDEDGFTGVMHVALSRLAVALLPRRHRRRRAGRARHPPARLRLPRRGLWARREAARRPHGQLHAL